MSSIHALLICLASRGRSSLDLCEEPIISMNKEMISAPAITTPIIICDPVSALPIWCVRYCEFGSSAILSLHLKGFPNGIIAACRINQHFGSSRRTISDPTRSPQYASIASMSARQRLQLIGSSAPLNIARSTRQSGMSKQLLFPQLRHLMKTLNAIAFKSAETGAFFSRSKRCGSRVVEEQTDLPGILGFQCRRIVLARMFLNAHVSNIS